MQSPYYYRRFRFVSPPSPTPFHIHGLVYGSENKAITQSRWKFEKKIREIDFYSSNLRVSIFNLIGNIEIGNRSFFSLHYPPWLCKFNICKDKWVKPKKKKINPIFYVREFWVMNWTLLYCYNKCLKSNLKPILDIKHEAWNIAWKIKFTFHMVIKSIKPCQCNNSNVVYYKLFSSYFSYFWNCQYLVISFLDKGHFDRI